MNRLSLGLLLSSQSLLEVVERHSTVSAALHEQLPKVLVVDTHTLVNLSIRCGWLVSDQQGQLSLSSAGRTIRSEAGTLQGLRRQLADFIVAERPTWLSQIPIGRNETLSVLSADIKDVFREAGLWETPPSKEVVGWWDAVGTHARAARSAHLTSIGREGEQLSIDFEELRTGKRPYWESVETNRAGYDLLSVITSSSPAPLLIEVKGSRQSLNSATFFVSRGEWEVANNSEAYVFHLWLIGDEPRLAAVEAAEVEAHIANNRGAGVWQNVEVPMAAFEDRFAPFPGYAA